jgi:hypothetical protein
MDDRKRFAAMVFAVQISLIDKETVITAADRHISEVEAPSDWLIDLSLQGDSPELQALVRSADEDVLTDILRMAYRAWTETRIPDKRFIDCFTAIWQITGRHSRWYYDLVGIENEFELMEVGAVGREDSIRRIKAAVEKLIQ